MNDIVLATYKRESTLWKNANSFYKAQDWVLMECIYRDRSDDRKDAQELGISVIADDKDCTEEFYADKYVVRLTNKSGRKSREFSFDTKDDANRKFKEVLNHKVLRGWAKA